MTQIKNWEAIVPARKGSKRLPNKNMYLINDKPLLEYTIEYINRSLKVNDVYVTTDDDIISEYCFKNKIKVIRRPESLGGDTPIIDVYKHALVHVENHKNIEILLGVQVDHPDRNLSLDKVIEIFKKEKADRLFSTEKDGKKNGAHYVLSSYFLNNNVSRKDVNIIDDCTNIHYLKDIEKAKKNL